MSPPLTTPADRRLLPVSYASETEPFAHCEIETMTTPRSQASLSAPMRSGRCGALPAPYVSRTTPCVGGARNARTVAAVMPGKRRSVAGKQA